MILESDVLICEPTSLVAEYSITNNPILLQGNYEELNGIGKKIIKKKNIVNDFDDIYNILKKCKHKNIKVYSNNYFYKNKYKLNFSDYLIKLLIKDTEMNPKSNYFKKLLDIHYDNLYEIRKILSQGYYKENIIVSQEKIIKDIDNLLKMWSDEIISLKSKE